MDDWELRRNWRAAFAFNCVLTQPRQVELVTIVFSVSTGSAPPTLAFKSGLRGTEIAVDERTWLGTPLDCRVINSD